VRVGEVHRQPTSSLRPSMRAGSEDARRRRPQVRDQARQGRTPETLNLAFLCARPRRGRATQRPAGRPDSRTGWRRGHHRERSHRQLGAGEPDNHRRQLTLEGAPIRRARERNLAAAVFPRIWSSASATGLVDGDDPDVAEALVRGRAARGRMRSFPGMRGYVSLEVPPRSGLTGRL
jgi:hypothetical protein